MTLADILLNLALAFGAIVVALWYENLGAPRVVIQPGKTTDDVKPNGRRTRFLHLDVLNSPRRVPLVTRQTAFAAHGSIQFHAANGEPISGAMPIRWDGSPEPVKHEILNASVVSLLDHRLLRISRFIEIFPDEKESLAVAVRILGDNEAYGWTGESYIHDWRHPDFRLPLGTLRATVRIATGDTVTTKQISFNNPPKFEEFDLTPTLGDA